MVMMLITVSSCKKEPKMDLTTIDRIRLGMPYDSIYKMGINGDYFYADWFYAKEVKRHKLIKSLYSNSLGLEAFQFMDKRVGHVGLIYPGVTNNKISEVSILICATNNVNLPVKNTFSYHDEHMDVKVVGQTVRKAVMDYLIDLYKAKYGEPDVVTSNEETFFKVGGNGISSFRGYDGSYGVVKETKVYQWKTPDYKIEILYGFPTHSYFDIHDEGYVLTIGFDDRKEPIQRYPPYQDNCVEFPVIKYLPTQATIQSLGIDIPEGI